MPVSSSCNVCRHGAGNVYHRTVEIPEVYGGVFDACNGYYDAAEDGFLGGTAGGDVRRGAHDGDGGGFDGGFGGGVGFDDGD